MRDRVIFTAHLLRLFKIRSASQTTSLPVRKPSAIKPATNRKAMKLFFMAI